VAFITGQSPIMGGWLEGAYAHPLARCHHDHIAALSSNSGFPDATPENLVAGSMVFTPTAQPVSLDD